MSRRLRIACLLVPSIAALLSLPIASADEEGAPELAVVVHAENRARVSPAAIEAMFLLRQRRWPDGSPVIPFTYPPGEWPRVVFDRAVFGFSQDESARYWIDQRIRNGARPPRQTGDPVLALRLTGRLKGAIAYVPASMVNDSVRVVARIRGGRVLQP
jgi:hypothetical protein